MKRTKIEKRGLPPLPVLVGWVLACAFVGVSGLMSVSYGWAVGAPSGMGYVFAALAVAVTGFKALGLALTFGRGQRLAGFIALPLVIACFAYAVTAGHQFAAENFYKAANRTDAVNTDYEVARDRVSAIRAELTGIAETRDAAVIEAAIEGHKQHPRWGSTKGCTDATVNESFSYCQEYFGLQRALAVAEKRGRLAGELDARLADIRGASSSAGVSHDAGPVAALIGRLTGYRFESHAEFAAWLIVLIVELGDIVTPLVMTMAARQPARRDKPVSASAQVARIIEEAHVHEVARKALKTERERRREASIAQLQRFMDICTERNQDSEIASASFYSVYTTWAIGEGIDPMTIQLFGSLLTGELKLPKVKKSVTLYLGVRVRSNWHVKPALRAVSGGKS